MASLNIILLIVAVIFVISAFLTSLLFIIGADQGYFFSETFKKLIFTSIKYKSTGKNIISYEIINFIMFMSLHTSFMALKNNLFNLGWRPSTPCP